MKYAIPLRSVCVLVPFDVRTTVFTPLHNLPAAYDLVHAVVVRREQLFLLAD